MVFFEEKLLRVVIYVIFGIGGFIIIGIGFSVLMSIFILIPGGYFWLSLVGDECPRFPPNLNCLFFGMLPSDVGESVFWIVVVGFISICGTIVGVEAAGKILNRD